MQIGPKTLVFDSEISKTIYGAYPSKKPQFLRSEDIIQDWFTICIAWRWRGSKKINCVSLLDDIKRYRRDPFDDYHVIKEFHAVLKEAEVIVGHNMANFDWKKFMERAICHKLPPIQKPIIVDTMKLAQQFGFSYKSLAYLSKRLKTREKAANGGNDMWMDIIRGRAESRIKECVKYCIGDIEPAEDLYDRLAPYVPNRMLPNANLWRGNGVKCCPACGGTEFKRNGHRYTSVSIIPRNKCLNKSCGKHFDAGKAIKRVVMR